MKPDVVEGDLLFLIQADKCSSRIEWTEQLNRFVYRVTAHNAEIGTDQVEIIPEGVCNDSTGTVRFDQSDHIRILFFQDVYDTVYADLLAEAPSAMPYIPYLYF